MGPPRCKKPIAGSQSAYSGIRHAVILLIAVCLLPLEITELVSSVNVRKPSAMNVGVFKKRHLGLLGIERCIFHDSSTTPGFLSHSTQINTMEDLYTRYPHCSP
jgi:hypothetical protein